MISSSEADASPRHEKILTSRIQCIDINTQVHRFLRTNPVSNLLNNALRTNSINYPRLHDLKPAVTVVVVVAEARQRGADPDVDVSVVGEEAFFVCVVEVGAVVDGGLF